MVVPLRWRQKLLASATLIAFVCAFAQGVDHADPQFRKPINCKVLTDGNYVWGCSRFYSVCANGQEHSLYCYTGLVFNPDNDQCDLPKDTIPCQTAGDVNLYKSKLPFTCNGRPDGKYEAGLCQPQYFQCIHGIRNTLPCPMGLVFVPKDNACDSEANCKKILNGPVPTQARYINQGLPPSPQPAVPQGYVSGQISQPTTTQAPNPRQTRYGSNRQVTSPTKRDPSAKGEDVPFDCSGKEDGVYLKSQSACTSVFYRCTNERGLQYQCPLGLSYNVDNNQCDYDRFVIACGGTPPPTPYPMYFQQRRAIRFNCRNKEDGLYAISMCSPVFFSCIPGHVPQINCSAGNVYDEVARLCEFPYECGKTKQAFSKE
ncbi:chitin binding peritrophin-A domain-containing protein [Ditylenchus destructor]|nr:chitin binding peritrophin-A domain-containing protein [Ditylenchus destructor]